MFLLITFNKNNLLKKITNLTTLLAMLFRQRYSQRPQYSIRFEPLQLKQ